MSYMYGQNSSPYSYFSFIDSHFRVKCEGLSIKVFDKAELNTFMCFIKKITVGVHQFMKRSNKVRVKKHTSITSVPELIVHENKTRKISLLLLPLLAALGFDVLFKLYNWSSSISIKTLLFIVLIVFAVFSMVRFFQLLKLYISKAPVLILNKDGLWVKQCGVIPWDNILVVEEFIINPFSIEGEDLVSLGIRLRDPEVAFKKTMLGRVALKLVRRRNPNYHILVRHLDISYQEISQFAEKFISKNQQISPE